MHTEQYLSQRPLSPVPMIWNPNSPSLMSWLTAMSLFRTNSISFKSLTPALSGWSSIIMMEPCVEEPDGSKNVDSLLLLTTEPQRPLICCPQTSVQLCLTSSFTVKISIWFVKQIDGQWYGWMKWPSIMFLHIDRSHSHILLFFLVCFHNHFCNVVSEFIKFRKYHSFHISALIQLISLPFHALSKQTFPLKIWLLRNWRYFIAKCRLQFCVSF